MREGAGQAFTRFLPHRALLDWVASLRRTRRVLMKRPDDAADATRSGPQDVANAVRDLPRRELLRPTPAMGPALG